MTLSARAGVRRGRDGRYVVSLPPHERAVLVSLPGEVSALARTGDSSVRRLFPPAYTDDPAAEEQYSQLVRSDLVDGCIASLVIFEKTANADSLDEDEIQQWLRALNSIRLVVGTKIDVQENESPPDPDLVTPDDIRWQGMLLYSYLTWLQGEVIDAVSSGPVSP